MRRKEALRSGGVDYWVAASSISVLSALALAAILRLFGERTNPWILLIGSIFLGFCVAPGTLQHRSKRPPDSPVRRAHRIAAVLLFVSLWLVICYGAEWFRINGFSFIPHEGPIEDHVAIGLLLGLTQYFLLPIVLREVEREGHAGPGRAGGADLRKP